MTEKKPNAKPRKTARAKPGTSRQAADDRRKRFVEAYITNGGNAKAAAITAGYSEKTADQQGSRLLKDVKVSDAIDVRRAGLAKTYELTTDVVIRSISQELHFDPAKLYNDDGSLKGITELDEDVRMALTAVEFEQIGSPDAPVFVRKFKWASKYQAREQAMKHLGMFEKDNLQRNGALADLPREMVKQIVERLKQMNGRS